MAKKLGKTARGGTSYTKSISTSPTNIFDQKSKWQVIQDTTCGDYEVLLEGSKQECEKHAETL